MKSYHLIIGLGEVGRALSDVLSPFYTVHGIDKEKQEADGNFDFIHVCFPYSGDFIKQVKEYADKFLAPAGIVVIHSSVPVGTTDQIGPRAVHSPIRGVHPNLEKGIRTFVKYCGGAKAHVVGDVFTRIGIEVVVDRDSRNTEALKLWDTTQYGLMIMVEKAVYDYCEKNKLNFNLVYADANRSYNSGYTKLGMDYVVRPVLNHVPGPIGGHCVIANAKLLEAPLAKHLLDVDDELRNGVKSK